MTLLKSESKTSMQDVRQISPAIRLKMQQVRDNYGTSETFLSKMNVNIQPIAAKYPKRCFTGYAPTLNVLSSTYGHSVAISWLTGQICDLVAYTNSKHLLTPQHVDMLAQMITQQYGYLKCSELMLFFYNFKMGKYGQFYGVVDPMKITIGLNAFLDERMQWLDQIEKEAERKEREDWAKDAITPEQYCKQHGLPDMDIFELMEHFSTNGIK